MTGSRYGDFSRFLAAARKHYSAVLMQQGRVQLDSDWNAQADIAADRLRTAAVDLVGAAGGPAGNAGFELQPRFALRFEDQQLATVGGGEGPLFSPAGGLTIEVWARPEAAGTLLSGVSRRADEEAFREDLALEVTADRRVRCHRGHAAHPDLETAPAVTFGQPVQLAVACDGHHTHLYVDGALAAHDRHGCQLAGGGEAALLIGASLVDGAQARQFHGLICELRIWGVTRSEDEIRAALRQAPAGSEADLLGWWRFDQGRGGVVADRSSHGNPCLLGGGRGEDDPSRPRWCLSDLLIGPGRYYVDGIACEIEAPVSFAQQPDLPCAALPPLDGAGHYLFYLDVWERTVTAVEDPALLEPALGGADTTARSRVTAQVRWLQLHAAADAAGLPAGSVGAQPRAGELPEWRQLLALENGRGQLHARRHQDAAATLGNLLYRVEIHQGGAASGEATFKWSRNNASPAWAIARATAGSALVVLAESGRDDLEITRDDWVEILDDRSVLSAPALPGGPAALHRVESVDADRRQVTLAEPLAAAGVPDPGLHPLLRRWDQRGHAGPGGVPVGTGWIPLEAGIEVSFTAAGTYRSGDHWWLPARTATESIEWPGGAQPEPRPPDGTDHHYAPLGLLVGDSEGLQCFDWRTTFRPLTAGAVSKSGDVMDGPLEVRADLSVSGRLRAGAIYGPLAEPASVGTAALQDGAVTAAKLAGGIGTLPEGAAVLTTSRRAPPGFRATGFTTALFDPAAGWSHRGELPRPAGGSLGSVAIEGRIFTLLAAGEVWEYAPESGRWHSRRPLPAARQACGVAALSGQLFAVGGLGGEGTRDGAVLAYDPAADEWRERRPMPTPRSDLAAAAIGGVLYAMGGLRDSVLGPRICRHLEVYDPESDVWSAARPLPEGRAGLGAAVLGDRIHVLGGAGPTFFGLGRSPRSTHLSYSPVAGRWHVERAVLPAPRSAAGVVAAAGRLYVIGGRGPFGEVSDVDEYDPAAGTWTPRAPLPRPLEAPGAAALGGTLYVVGGADGPDSPSTWLQEAAFAAVLWLHEKTSI
jgi:hypothetical protein